MATPRSREKKPSPHGPPNVVIILRLLPKPPHLVVLATIIPRRRYPHDPRPGLPRLHNPPLLPVIPPRVNIRVRRSPPCRAPQRILMLREPPDLDRHLAREQVVLVPQVHHAVELPEIGRRDQERLALQRRHPALRQLAVQLRARQVVRRRDGDAEVRHLAVDELARRDVETHYSQLVQRRDNAPHAAELPVVQVHPLGAQLLEDAPDGRRPPALTPEPAASLLFGLLVAPVAVEGDARVLYFQGALVCLGEQHVAEALDGEVLVAGLAEAGEGAALAVEGL